jgi:hypothetical protein
MRINSHTLQGLDETRELNRLFLTFVSNYPEVAELRFALPVVATRRLHGASAEYIATIARYPQALFRLRLHDSQAPLGTVLEPAQRAMQLTLLVSAHHMSRQSGYAARWFLQLAEKDVDLLRATRLSDLPALSLKPDLVGCAHADLEWTWRELLDASTPERSRRLLLLSLRHRAGLGERATERLPDRTV